MIDKLMDFMEKYLKWTPHILIFKMTIKPKDEPYKSNPHCWEDHYFLTMKGAERFLRRRAVEMEAENLEWAGTGGENLWLL